MSGSLFPGAPALLYSALGASGSIPALQIADALGLNSETGQNLWGIYDQSGNAVIVVNSVVKFSYQNETKISDYQQEQGGFTSYNKVQNPFQIDMQVAFGGSFSYGNIASALASGSLTGAFLSLTGTTARATFLQSLDTARESLAIVNVVTPEMTYPSANITRVDYDRSAAQGATLLMVNIRLEEVRVTAIQNYSNTQSPNGAGAVNTGPTQATNPTVPQSAAITQTPLQ